MGRLYAAALSSLEKAYAVTPVPSQGSEAADVKVTQYDARFGAANTTG